jgi:hypothetical protein
MEDSITLLSMVWAVEAEREDIHKVPGRRGVADLECVIFADTKGGKSAVEDTGKNRNLKSWSFCNILILRAKEGQIVG